ncbi:TadG family pilus assembly protein [Sulfitobacter geojensis]|uniref:TadG family pilus assembly protein n=1 Tax=Sulfitobacter geojensis TaxID=1342299 RepID=UPI003B8B256A
MRIKSPIFTAFARDEGGAIAVVVSLLLTVLLGFVALGIDVAALYRENANLQADADLAAMSSVRDPDQATPRAQRSLGKNKRENETLTELVKGRYLRNPEIPRENRFTPLSDGNPAINAVRVKLEDDGPLYFAKIFTQGDHVDLTRRATAIRTGAASFSLNSSIARLDLADLNLTLSESFGTEISITAGEHEALASTDVDMEDFLEELNRLVGNGSRNPAEILDAEATAADVFTALQNVLPAGTAGSLNAVMGAGGALPVAVSALVGGIDSGLGLTAFEFASDVELTALDIVKAVASTNSYSNALNADAALGVAGVTTVATRLALGEPPAHSGWVALGEQGVQLHRAATRVLTEVNLEPNLLGALGVGVSVTSLNVPVYVEVAGSTATLEEISCASEQPDALAARFSTASTPLSPENGTSVAALYLGKIAEDVFTQGPISPSDLGFADILEVTLRVNLLVGSVEVPGITIQARSNIAVGQSQTESIRFTNDDVKNGRMVRHFGSGELVGSAISTLLSPAHTELRVKPGQEGLVTGLVAPLLSNVLAILPDRLLGALATPLDGVVDTVLNGAGLRLGEGELTLNRHHCEAIRLVQ